MPSKAAEGAEETWWIGGGRAAWAGQGGSGRRLAGGTQGASNPAGGREGLEAVAIRMREIDDLGI